MNSLVSIVIPIYNVERFLNECLQSVLAQTYTSFELLLINDGSTDSSGMICNTYLEKDNRIKVFHKENGGVSSARNLGILEANGEWLLFVDGDDELHPNALENYLKLNSLKEADIIFSNYIVKSKLQEEKVSLNPNEKLEGENLINNIIAGKIHGALWNKLINKKLLLQTKFSDNIIFMEDKLFLIELLLKEPKIEFLNEVTYRYFIRDESATGNFSEKSLLSIRKVNEKLIRILSNEKYENTRFTIKLNEKILLMKKSQPCHLVRNIYKEINADIFKSNRVPLQLKVLFWFEFKRIRMPSYLYFKLKKLMELR